MNVLLFSLKGGAGGPAGNLKEEIKPMTNKMKNIKIMLYRGMTLREAVNYINAGGLTTTPMDMITLNRRKQQKALRTIWHDYCFPFDGCLVEADYGQHIKIICTTCGARGTTKNISPLGCRTLFIACKCKDWSGIKLNSINKPV